MASPMATALNNPAIGVNPSPFTPTRTLMGPPSVFPQTPANVNINSMKPPIFGSNTSNTMMTPSHTASKINTNSTNSSNNPNMKSFMNMKNLSSTNSEFELPKRKGDLTHSFLPFRNLHLESEDWEKNIIWDEPTEGIIRENQKQKCSNEEFLV